METNAQECSVSDLVKQQDYDGAIARLKAIPEEQRTLQDKLSGCIAVINCKDWLTPKHLHELQQVRSFLIATAKEAEDGGLAGSCYRLLTLASRQLGEYKDAVSYSKKAAKLKNELPKELISEVITILHATPNTEGNFRAGVKKAWAAFSRQEKDLRRLMNNARRNPDALDKLRDRMNSVLNIAFHQTAWSWDGGDIPLLQLETGERKCIALQQQYFLDHAPKEIAKRWELSVGDKAPAGAMAVGADLWLGDSDVQLEPVEGGMFRLILFHPLLAGTIITASIRQQVQDQIFEHVGELVYISLIQKTILRDKPLEGPSIKLAHLLQTLEAIGYADRRDIPALLHSRHRYSRIPKPLLYGSKYLWRSDVFRGITMDRNLCDSYFVSGITAEETENSLYTMEALSGSGAVPGFVIFPLQGQTTNPPALMETLLQELDAAMDEENSVVLGEAEGLMFGYLDLLTWDLQPALDTVKEVLSKHNLPWACWHTFFPFGPTVQIL